MNLAFLYELSDRLDEALSRFDTGDNETRDLCEFARRLNLRTWERNAVKRLVDESYLT